MLTNRKFTQSTCVSEHPAPPAEGQQGAARGAPNAEPEASKLTIQIRQIYKSKELE